MNFFDTVFFLYICIEGSYNYSNENSKIIYNPRDYNKRSTFKSSLIYNSAIHFKKRKRERERMIFCHF